MDDVFDKCITHLDIMDQYQKETEMFSEGDKTILIALRMLKSDIHNAVDKFISMKKKDITNKVLDVIERIIVHAKTLYESEKIADPFDDLTYDRMLSKFKEFRAEPFANNMAGVSNAEYIYEKLSGTLDKVHFIYESDRGKHETRKSLEEYIDKIKTHGDDLYVMINQKKDGTSLTCNYVYKGNYTYVAESSIGRGKKDYGIGTDTTIVTKGLEFKCPNIKKIIGFIPDKIGIQYEFMVSDKQKTEFEKYTNKKYANCRAAATGLLRRMLFSSKKECKSLRRFMSIVPVGFDILNEDMKKDFKSSWDEIYSYLCTCFIYGDIDMEYTVLHGDKKYIMKKFANIARDQLDKRYDINHAIDGLVLTIINPDIQKELGRKNGINRWQIAYKFPEEEYKTKIRDVMITTGNFGYKEMLLIVDPVILNGTKQEKAQIHSLNKFKKMDLRIGDEIKLKLSGDVIPYGYKDSTCKKGTGKKLKFPKVCECGATLVEEKNKMRCPNKSCPHRIIGALHTFFVELNAKGIGEKTCKQLYDELGITSPSQILQLNIRDFESLNGFKEASAKICMNTINDILNKPKTLPSILSSLAIDSFRSSTAVKLLDIVSINDLIKLIDSGSIDELSKLIKRADGIDNNAKIIANGLYDKKDELKKLLSMLTIKNVNNNFDKTILVSGFRADDNFVDIANAAGYNVKDTGTNFDLLVIKNGEYLNKTKGRLAQKKGIEIITIDEFNKKFNS